MMNDLAGLELCTAKLLENHSDNVFLGHDSIFLPGAQEAIPPWRFVRMLSVVCRWS